MACANIPAQPPFPGISPWTGYAATIGQRAMSSPPGYGFTPDTPTWDAWPGPQPSYDRRSSDYKPSAGCDAYRSAADDYQPDLTGSWRGSGGETVEITRNRARIWGGAGGHRSCSCVFFRVGQRLIAYSPDSDRVRKYWFRQISGDRFALLDDSGNLMSFWRVR
jgi:hypothetical protein